MCALSQGAARTGSSPGPGARRKGIPMGLTSQGPFHGPQQGSRAGQEGSQGQPQTPSSTSVGKGCQPGGWARLSRARAQLWCSWREIILQHHWDTDWQLWAELKRGPGPWGRGGGKPQGRLDRATEDHYCPQCPDI